jgi:hypothetical protein
MSASASIGFPSTAFAVAPDMEAMTSGDSFQRLS